MIAWHGVLADEKELFCGAKSAQIMYIICSNSIQNIRTAFAAKFPHSPTLRYACRSLLTENNRKNNATAVGLCAVFNLVFLAGETKDYIH